ncbi:MAG: peptidoglycan endopeptidase [Verrucomicrobiaceae bacterium]
MAWQYKNYTPPASPVSLYASQPGSRSVPAAEPYPPLPDHQRNLVRLVGNRAIAPPHAPSAVKRAVAAGNHLQRFPYKFGGGHAILNDRGYDCSGSVSYVLREAGLLHDQMTSRGFLTYGERGLGEWITVWAKNGHVYMTIGGLRLDTGGPQQSNGPRWKSEPRSPSGFSPRHPRGL